MHVIEVLVVGMNEARDRLLDHCSARNSQQGRGRQIGLHDEPVLVERAIPDWREIVEIEIARLHGVQSHLRPAQLLILEFQFDLMYLKFMKGLSDIRLAGLGLRQRSALASYDFLSLFSEADGIAGGLAYRGHGDLLSVNLPLWVISVRSWRWRTFLHLPSPMRWR